MRKTTIFQLSGIALLVLVAIALMVPRGTNRPPSPPPPATAQAIDLVIALDTSSSMDGLIDSARQKLWDVVNVLGQAQPRPVLRVGLVSYGNSSYDAAVGWVRKESDLTSDLDGIYAKLFALRTDGGEEYVARAVQAATREMEWNSSALKIVFVAGNEPANQDPTLAVEAAVTAAREKGINVNTIYCGSESAGEAQLWRLVASRGGGRYAAIDQNSAVVVATPVDDELSRLSAALNDTYVGYGAGGGAGLAQQAAMDKSAGGLGAGVAATRAVAKGGKLYDNSHWDLVDAVMNGKKSVEKMEERELPAPMAAMAPAERKEFVAEKAKQRGELQEKINRLAKQRADYVKAAPKKPGNSGIDDALSGTVVEQAKSAGFKF